MSENSSKKPVRPSRLSYHASSAFLTIGYSVWMLVSVFGIGSLIAVAVLYAGMSQIDLSFSSMALTQMALSVAVYIVGALVLLIEPIAIRNMAADQVKKLLGVARMPIIRDIGLGLIAWGAYMPLTIAVQYIAGILIPWINIDQQQEIGFESLVGSVDIVAAFIVIVIAAPIIEEVIFRGYLYGSLRPRMPWWVAGIIVSILFGAVHGQWNVGLDTFVLSMVACYLREQTGAIWSGILLHALKNSLAFYILFLAPEQLRQLLMGA